MVTNSEYLLVLVLEMLFDLPKLMHETLQLSDSIVMQKDSIKLSSSVLAFVFLQNLLAVVTHLRNQSFYQLPHISVVGNISWQIAELVLFGIIAFCLLD